MNSFLRLRLMLISFQNQFGISKEAMKKTVELHEFSNYAQPQRLSSLLLLILKVAEMQTEAILTAA